MKKYLVVRRKEGCGTEILEGASPISKAPMWEKWEGIPVTHPLTFRTWEYAEWCRFAAERDSKDASWSYEVAEVIYPDWKE